jgi:hypothetical protein
MTKLSLFFLFLFTIESVLGQQSISACYSCNFTIIGWFGTRLKLNDDHSFDYLFQGDLFHDHIDGTYEIEGNLIKLNYKEERDSIEYTGIDSLGNSHTFLFHIPENNAVNFRPSKLKIQGARLILYDQEGKMIRRKMNAREKWRKYYLIKIPCE